MNGYRPLDLIGPVSTAGSHPRQKQEPAQTQCCRQDAPKEYFPETDTPGLRYCCSKRLVRRAVLYACLSLNRLRQGWYAFRLTNFPDIGYKTISALGHSLDILMHAAIIVKSFPQDRNRDGKIALLHERAGPYSLQQFVLLNKMPTSLHQDNQQVERLRRHRNRLTVAEQETLWRI